MVFQADDMPDETLKSIEEAFRTLSVLTKLERLKIELNAESPVSIYSEERIIQAIDVGRRGFSGLQNLTEFSLQEFQSYRVSA
jgi:hypothetical protein